MHKRTHSARQNNKCAALLCAGFDKEGEWFIGRVCSGCCCNQRSPKAWPSHRKSSASTTVTSCPSGESLGVEDWGRGIQTPPLTWFHAPAVAAIITPVPRCARSPSDVFPREFKNEWKHALLKATYPAYGRRWAHTLLALIEKQWENSFIFQRE